MARFVRAATRRTLLPSSSSSSKSFSSFFFQSRPHSTTKITKPPARSNILRILNNEGDYQSEYPPSPFDSIHLQCKIAGELWMAVKRKFSDSEYIKLDDTMFDGYERVLKARDCDSSGEEQLRLHISALVDIRRKDGTDALAFECSAGPIAWKFRKFARLAGVRKALREYLEERGVNDELCAFLHEYMTNKDRIEVIQWFKSVNSFMEEWVDLSLT